MNHTKEPWIAVPGGRHDPEVIITTQHRLDQSKGEICGMDVEFTGKHGDEQKANARRIVACVNALENVSTEWLEAQNGIVCLGSPIKDRFLEIEKQRDELLADVERCYKMLLSDPDTQGALFKAENILREAIAAVRGAA